MTKLKWLPALIAAACVGLAGAQEPGVRLPDIGSSAASAMSPDEMEAYGASMLHEMRAYNYVLDDPQVTTTSVRSVTDWFRSATGPISVPFFVVRSNEITLLPRPADTRHQCRLLMR